MIDITKLSESDVGREVIYRTHFVITYGRITSWNDRFIFVRYHTELETHGNWRARDGETSEATNPSDLEFAAYGLKALAEATNE